MHMANCSKLEGSNIKTAIIYSMIIKKKEHMLCTKECFYFFFIVIYAFNFSCVIRHTANIDSNRYQKVQDLNIISSNKSFILIKT